MPKRKNVPFLIDDDPKIDWLLKYSNGRMVWKDDILAHKIVHQLGIAQTKCHTAIVCVLGERGSGKSQILDALIRRIVQKDVSIFTHPTYPQTDRSDDLVIATTAVIIPDEPTQNPPETNQKPPATNQKPPDPIQDLPVSEGVGILFIDVRSWTESSPFYLKVMEFASQFATVKLCSNYKILSPELSKLAFNSNALHINKEDVTWSGQNIVLGSNLYIKIWKRIKYAKYHDRTFYGDLLERFQQISGVQQQQQQMYQRAYSRPFVPTAFQCFPGPSGTLSASASRVQGSSGSLDQIGDIKMPHCSTGLHEQLNTSLHSRLQPNTSQYFRLQYQRQRQDYIALLQKAPSGLQNVPPVNCAAAMNQAFASSYMFYFNPVDLFDHHLVLRHRASDACAYRNLEKFHLLLQGSFTEWYSRAQTQLNDAIQEIESTFIRCVMNKADPMDFTVNSKVAEIFANNLRVELSDWHISEVDTIVQRWQSYISFHYNFVLEKLKKELQSATDIFIAYNLRLRRMVTKDSRLPPHEFPHVAQYIYSRILAEKPAITSDTLRKAVSSVSEQMERKASEENTRLFRMESASALQAVEHFLAKFQKKLPFDLPGLVSTDPPPKAKVSTSTSERPPEDPARKEEASVGIYLGEKSLVFVIIFRDAGRTMKYEKALSPFISLSQEGLQMDQPNGDFNVHDILTDPTAPRSPKTLELGQGLPPITQEMAAVFYMHEAKKILDDLCGKDVSFACVLIPQLISGAAKTATKQSLRMAGFTNVQLVPFTMAIVLDHIERHPRLVREIISIHNSATVFEISRIAIDPRRGLIVEKTLSTGEVTAECVSQCLHDVKERWARPQAVLIQEEEGSSPTISHHIKLFGFEFSLGAVDSIAPSDTTLHISKYAEIRRQKLSTIAVQHDRSYDFRTIGGERKKGQDDSVWIYYHKSEADGDSLIDDDDKRETAGEFLIEDGIDKTAAIAEPRWSYHFTVSPPDVCGPVCTIKFEPDGSLGIEKLDGVNARVESKDSKFLSQWDREMLAEDVRRWLAFFSQPETTRRISGERSGG